MCEIQVSGYQLEYSRLNKAQRRLCQPRPLFMWVLRNSSPLSSNSWKLVFKAGANTQVVTPKNKRQINETPAGPWKNESAVLMENFAAGLTRRSAEILLGTFFFIPLRLKIVRHARRLNQRRAGVNSWLRSVVAEPVFANG